MLSIPFWRLGSIVALCACTSLFVACSTAPQNYGQHSTAHKGVTPNVYVVKAGDSLSKIGQMYGLDYVSIAKLNGIAPPYNNIRVGQKLLLKGASRNNQTYTATRTTTPTRSTTTTKTTPTYQTTYPTTNTTTRTPSVATTQPVVSSHLQWHKPVQTAHQQSFNTQTQTLYYLGQVGDPVYAVAAGQVVYANTTSSNSGLARYGHLIMIQHANDYVSVYAHNNRILVAQGERVQAGQRIGELGTSGQAPQQASVGIQIRQYAKNIDPRQLLPR